ncbi:hypothetical protein PFICI_00562 [Pestalotiopsis fici W106-1]|uniref:Uncharacterized protein n=1 Tax=Pestalotiopsis fici (strain W106-1 / CGMCC3.15140) TaxID=1229662 RepID=W3XL68_PESFW|nr:uncharacterized protein PFICI_00562 [Pestalotiopsis fici W106-1]ETS86734.1 hypothetical protein PFICI_00562 [Pestalotiopsis fici W106-1]
MSEANVLSTQALFTPISASARTCLDEFNRLLQSTLSLDGRRYSAIEDQMARFSLWTSNMAVFAPGRNCMDHRVREAPEVQRLILGILTVLQSRISECVELINRLNAQDAPIEEQFSALARGGFEQAAISIASEVTLLQSLANTIRKASRETQNDKALATFRMTDEEGNNLEAVIKWYFMKNLEDRFPESSEAIRERLASTMVLRRKRILYRRTRYSVNPMKAPDPVARPTTQMPSSFPRQMNTALQMRADRSAPKPLTAHSQLHSAVHSATTLTPHTFQRASAPSVVSQTRSVDLGAHESLVFPDAPLAQSKGMMDVTCPYCLYVLPSNEVTNADKWRKHVLGDLDALVCLFDPCDKPNVLFSHTKDWIRHMREHTRSWFCSSKLHAYKTFGDRGDFQNHLQNDHERKYTDAQIDFIIEKNTRSSGPLFKFCPLCGGQEENEKGPGISEDLINHIVGHLRSLAIKSLPPVHDQVEEDAYKSDIDNRRSRSTVRNAFDQAELVLDSPDSDSDDLNLDEFEPDEFGPDVWDFVPPLLNALPDDQDPIKLAIQSSMQSANLEATLRKEVTIVSEEQERQQLSSSLLSSPQMPDDTLLDSHKSSDSESDSQHRLTRRKRFLSPPAALAAGVVDAPLQSIDHDSSKSSNDSPRSHQHTRSLRSKNKGTTNAGHSDPTKRHLAAHGQTLFARACGKGDYEAARRHLAERPEDLDRPDYAGNTPLQVASRNGYEDIVEFLIGAGCSVKCQNDVEDTPLLDAVEYGHLGVVKLLLAAGVDPRKTDAEGQEPLERISDDLDNSSEMRNLLENARHRSRGRAPSIDLPPRTFLGEIFLSPEPMSEAEDKAEVTEEAFKNV